MVTLSLGQLNKTEQILSGYQKLMSLAKLYGEELIVLALVPQSSDPLMATTLFSDLFGLTKLAWKFC